MNNIPFNLLFCTFLTLNFYSPAQNPELVELPIQIVNGYGPFPINANLIDWKTHSPDSEWAKTEEKLSGIPNEWDNLLIKRIWFDMQQFAFQNYMQGIFNDEFFNELAFSWKMDIESRSYSEIPLKCYTHIALGKTAEGKIIYIIDTDNDKDFADEETHHPFILSDSMDMDSLSQFAHEVNAEILRHDTIRQVTFPVLIWQRGGMIFRNFPFYAKTNFNGVELNISSSFCHTAFYVESDLCIKPMEDQKSPKIIKLNQVITINGKRYKNLGLDMNKEVLQMEVFEKSRKLYSSQIGAYAKSFTGNDFQTNRTINLNDYLGKYVFLDFWGSWCKPCIKELPNLKKAYLQTDRRKIEFIGIVHDDSARFRGFLGKKDIQWPQILSTRKNDIVLRYNILGFPTTFLIDPEGKIVATNLRGPNLLDSLNYYINR
jgi:peroxiredoxin